MNEAVEAVRTVLDPYSAKRIYVDDMVYVNYKRGFVSLYDKPEDCKSNRVRFDEFADHIVHYRRVNGEWVSEIPVFNPVGDGMYSWKKESEEWQ